MIRRASQLIGAIFLLAVLAGCSAPPLYKQQAYVFGTLVEISVFGTPEAEARDAVDQVLANFDALHIALHAWEPGELNSLNSRFAEATADVPALHEIDARWAQTLLPILEDAATLSARSDGLFNPAIGNLVRLWGFHSEEFVPKLPDPAEIARLVKARPNMTDLHIDGTRVTTRNPALRLDLGGYAKGYALDLAARTLRQRGIQNALINIGGNVLAIGQHGDRPWKVGIQHPRKSGAIAMLALQDGEAIGTSGDYQRYFELNGQRYCHLIDPRTGWPVQGVQAVTVIAHGPNAGVLSDVASKPLFISGPTGWQNMAAKMGITEALLIDAEGRAATTPAMAKRLEWAAETPRF